MCLHDIKNRGYFGIILFIEFNSSDMFVRVWMSDGDITKEED